MFKSIKYFMMLAFMASFVSFTAFANNDCDYDDQDDYNTDDDCGTAAAECEWTFELVCPAEITCDDAVDLGAYCIGEDIDPTGDDSWVLFYIGGEVGRPFTVTVDVEENAYNEDQNDYDENVTVDGWEWEYSNSGGMSWSSLGLSGDQEEAELEAFEIAEGGDNDEGECVEADESNYQIRVRPTGITTTGSTAAGVYSVAVSLGVNFGYAF